MRFTSDRLTTRTAAAVLSGLMALTSAAPAFAQGKKPTPAAAGKAEPTKAAPAKPKKKLTEKQTKEEAKKNYKSGEAKFAKGDYAGALEDFQAADSLIPGAAPKFWIAETYEKLSKVPEAVTAYQTFLDSSPDAEKYKDKIADAKTRMDALKKTPAKVKVATDPAQAANLKLALDGAAQPGPELSVPPGHHTITATADGLEGKLDVDVTFAEHKDVTVKLEKAAPAVVAALDTPAAKPATTTAPAATTPAPATPPAAEKRSNVPAYVTLGLAVVGAGVGTVFGIQALGSKSDYNDNPTRDGLDKVERQSLLADMSYAVALTFGVTGVVLLLSNDSGSKPQQTGSTKTAQAKRSFVAAPYATPQGGGAAATLRF